MWDDAFNRGQQQPQNANQQGRQRLQSYLNSTGRFGGGLQAGNRSGQGVAPGQDDPGGRFQGGTSAFRAGSPEGGQVGAPNLGVASELNRWAGQVPGGQSHLYGMGMAPMINGLPFGSLGNPTADQNYQNTMQYMSNVPNASSMGMGQFQDPTYLNYVSNYNRQQQQQSPGQFSMPSMFGQGQGQIGSSAPGQGLARQFGVGGFSGSLNNPLAGRGGSGSAGSGIMGNLQNTINTMMRGSSGVPQNVENAMRTRVGDTTAGMQSSAEQRAREDAVRRGASTSGGGDSDIRDQLNRVAAEGSSQQIQGQQGIDQMLAQLTNQNRATGVGAGVNLASAQLRDQQQLRDLMLMMGMLQAQQGPMGGLSSILGGV